MDIYDVFIHSCEDGVGVGRQMKDNILIFKSGRFTTHTLASAAEAMEETRTHVLTHTSLATTYTQSVNSHVPLLQQDIGCCECAGLEKGDRVWLSGSLCSSESNPALCRRVGDGRGEPPQQGSSLHQP